MSRNCLFHKFDYFSRVNLREMMRRATSAARAVSGLDVRDPDRDDPGISIPTLSWPPDPPSYESVTRQGK